MFAARTRYTLAFLGAVLLPQTAIWAAATVNYQGTLYAGGIIQPYTGGKVIAATMKPGFDPDTIPCVYGDSVCNVGNTYYNQAVTDGNIIPIGTGTLSGAFGLFSGTGTTNATAGTKIYLLAFPFSNTNLGFTGVLGTGSDATFLVPAGNGTTNINAALANDFTFGAHFANGFTLGGLPIPEPSTYVLGVIGGAFLLMRARRTSRVSRSN